MKCKICGSELAEGSTICSVCGSPVEAAEQPVRKSPVRPVEDMDFNWNTFDFPKPKKPEDIEMSWPQFNVHHKIDAEEADQQISAAMANRRPMTIMRNDAQEGFVSVEPKPAAKPVQEPVSFTQPAPQPRQAASQPMLTPQPVMVWTMPAQQPVPASEPLWYTQPVPGVQPQMIPVQYVPVYTQPMQPAGPYTIAMQRADGQIPGMPEMKRQEAPAPAFPSGEELNQADDIPVDESWITAQLEPEEKKQEAAAELNKTAPWHPPIQEEPPVEPEPVVVPEPVAEPEPVVIPEPVAEPEPVVVPEPVVEPEPVVVPEPAFEPKPVVIPEPVAEPEPVVVPEPVAEPEPVAVPEPVVEPEPVVVPEPVREPETPDDDAPVRTERFYTFNKKNEEFQALLDAEYARLKSLRLGDSVTEIPAAAPVPETAPEDEDDGVIKVEDIISSAASGGLAQTKIWTEEDEVPVFNPAASPAKPAEIQAEELSAFEAMLMSGTKSRDEVSDETIRINLSNVRSSAVHPLADDVKIPDFVEPEKPAEAARTAPAVDKKIVSAEEVASRINDEMRKAEELDRQQRSLRKQRLEEMAKAREEYFGSSLQSVAKPASEVGTIGSRKAEEIRQELAEMKEEALKAAKADSTGTPETDKAAESSDSGTADKSETPADSAKPEKAHKTDKSDKHEKSQKSEKAEKTSRSARKEEVKERSYDDYTDDDYRRGGSWIVKLLIVIAVLVLLFEGARLMADRFIPDSTVTLFLENMQTDVVNAVAEFWKTILNGINVLFKR